VTIIVYDIRNESTEIMRGNIVKVTKGTVTDFIWILLDTGYEIRLSQRDLREIFEKVNLEGNEDDG